MASTERSEFAAQVKAATNLADLFREFGHDLKGSGHTLECCCPFHNEKTPSCKVHPDDNYWKCFGCGKGGDCFDFVMLSDNCEFPAALDKLADKAGLSDKPLTVQELAAYKHLPETFLRSLGVKEFAGGVVIPYFTAGKKAARARLRHSLRGKKRFTWGRKEFDGKTFQIVPYGVWKATGGAVLFIVEGETDCWAGWHHGINVLGLPGAENVKCLERDHVRYGKVIVIQEPGEAGAKFVQNVGLRLQAVGFEGEALSTPLGCKDMSELHINGGWNEGIHEAVEIAVPITVETPGDYTVLNEINDDISGKRRNIPIPDCPALTAAHAMLPGCITLLAGAPGASKTFCVLEWASKWFEYGEPVGVLALEKYATFHYRRILAMWTRAGWMTLPERVKERNVEALELEQSFRPLYKAMRDAQFLTLVPNDVDATCAWILAWMERTYASGKKILIVDPISLMQQTEGSRNIATDQNEFIAKAKVLNETHGGRLILVSHPTKDCGSEQPQEKFIMGSSIFSRATDTVMWLQPHERTPGKFWPLDAHGEPSYEYKQPEPVAFNRTMWILKKRNAPMHSVQIAMHFDGASLSHIERGFIDG